MSVLRDILTFARKERGYTFLFLMVAAAAIFVQLRPLPKEESEKKTQVQEAALERFREAEKKLEKKISESGLKEYLKKEPGLAALFQIFTILLMLALGIGLVFDSLFLFKPEWREKLKVPRPPPAAEWKVSMVFKVAVLFVAASFLIGLVLGLAQRIIPFISTNFYLILHTTIADILCFIFIVYIVKKENGTLGDLGFRLPEGSFWKEMRFGLGAYAAVLPLFLIVLTVLLFLAEIFHYEPPAHPLVNVFLEEEKRAPFLIGYSIFLATVLGPILEEVFFRGFFYQAFKARFGMLPAMIISAAFFALIHDNTFAFWPIFILGMGLAAIFELRGSLLASITLHVTHNFVFISYFFLAKKVIGVE